MIAVDDEKDFSLQIAKPGIISWGIVIAIVLGLLVFNFYWFETTEIRNDLGNPSVIGLERIVNEHVPRVLEVLGHLSALGYLYFAAAFAMCFTAICRMHKLSSQYAFSAKFRMLTTVLAYMAIVPAVMYTYCGLDFFFGLMSTRFVELLQMFSHKSSFYGTVKSLEQGSGVSFSLSLFFLAMFFLQSIYFPLAFVHRWSGGLIIGVEPWRILWGAKVIAWSEIKRASLIRNGKQELLVLQLANQLITIPLKDVKGFDPTDFMNDLRTNSNAIVEDSIAMRQETNRDSSTYTELWLKYFTSSASRNKKGQLECGDRLHNDEYEVAGTLGAGGQGTAYLASCKNEARSQTVVLKEYILPVHRGDSIFQQCLSKLQREADILQQIEHESIVRLIDMFVEDHRGYLVLEYVEGRTLKEIVDSEGAQAEHIVLEMALQICDMLEHLHSKNPPIIHRDLTPDNLILQADGKLKLVDFNVAQQLESQGTATVVGKHAYLPPEQFRGKPTTQSDIYAVGATIYFLLTGSEPQPLTSSHPQLLVQSISEKLDSLVADATCLDLSRRVSSAEELRERVLSISKSLSTISTTAGVLVSIKDQELETRSS